MIHFPHVLLPPDWQQLSTLGTSQTTKEATAGEGGTVFKIHIKVFLQDCDAFTNLSSQPNLPNLKELVHAGRLVRPFAGSQASALVSGLKIKFALQVSTELNVTQKVGGFRNSYCLYSPSFFLVCGMSHCSELSVNNRTKSSSSSSASSSCCTAEI